MLRYVIWSAVLGPPAALATAILAAMAESAILDADTSHRLRLGWQDTLAIAGYAALLAYLVGILPSILAGFLNCRSAQRLRGTVSRLALAACVGAVLGLAVLLVFRKGASPGLSEALIWALAGVAGSCVPAIVASRRAAVGPEPRSAASR